MGRRATWLPNDTPTFCGRRRVGRVGHLSLMSSPTKPNYPDALDWVVQKVSNYLIISESY